MNFQISFAEFFSGVAETIMLAAVIIAFVYIMLVPYKMQHRLYRYGHSFFVKRHHHRPIHM